MIVIASAYWLWMAFLVTWWLAAVWTNKAISYGAVRQRIVYFASLALGFALLFTTPPMILGQRHVMMGLGGVLPRAWHVELWHDPAWLAILLLVTELAALAFAWWSRLHLGRLWSGMLTLRQGHRVVDTGPYALVRHPIYTAFIAASWALALIVACPAVLMGAVVLTIVMTLKAGTEERLLKRYFGPATYDAYRSRVPMLIPFAPH